LILYAVRKGIVS